MLELINSDIVNKMYFNNIEVPIYLSSLFFYLLTCVFSLIQRKEQWKREEEERQASMPDPSIPPGHILMPKHEQQQTLQLLRQRKYLSL